MSPLITALLLAPSAGADNAFEDTIHRVESMVWEDTAQSLVQRHGLSLVNVTWEDTGRSKGSVWGPNISDMTIGVRDSQGLLHPMPVIRYDNFNDRTADVDSSRFWLKVGNEDGRRLRTVSLAEVLQETRGYLHDPGSWAGDRSGLWADRDEEVLVSAQAAFLPIPRAGEATFTPVIYNYQSYPGNPAVLTIVATREGTSIQVVENDGGYMSEPLFFNQDGERAPFTATRLSDFQRTAEGQASGVAAGTPEAAGLSAVLVIQVPLKQAQPARSLFDDWTLFGGEAEMAAPAAAMERSDMESAVIGHGEVEGPYSEINGLKIERDERFPVRVTVQFYKATSDGRVTDADVAAVREQIEQVYAGGNAVGSLVTDGYTGRGTEWVDAPAEQAQWAAPVWGWLRAW
jgi:hypothetical protein